MNEQMSYFGQLLSLLQLRLLNIFLMNKQYSIREKHLEKTLQSP